MLNELTLAILEIGTVSAQSLQTAPSQQTAPSLQTAQRLASERLQIEPTRSNWVSQELFGLATLEQLPCLS